MSNQYKEIHMGAEGVRNESRIRIDRRSSELRFEGQMCRVELASEAFRDQGLRAVGCHSLMATDHDLESDASGSDPGPESEEALTQFIRKLTENCLQRMDWIDRDLCVGKPCEIVLKVQTELINVDHNILNDLLPDASTQVKRRRLKDLKALSQKMLE